jgi:hypothetical protein
MEQCLLFDSKRVVPKGVVGMTSGKLDDFGGYRKALALFDLVVEDTDRYLKSARCQRLVSQQIASADSVCANIEEGYAGKAPRNTAAF